MRNVTRQIGLSICALFFMGLGSILLWFGIANMIINARLSKNKETTKCIIVDISYSTRSSDKTIYLEMFDGETVIKKHYETLVMLFSNIKKGDVVDVSFDQKSEYCFVKQLSIQAFLTYAIMIAAGLFSYFFVVIFFLLVMEIRKSAATGWFLK